MKPPTNAQLSFTVLNTICSNTQLMYSWRWAYRCPKHVELFKIINKFVHQVDTSRHFHIWCTDTHTSKETGVYELDNKTSAARKCAEFVEYLRDSQNLKKDYTPVPSFMGFFCSWDRASLDMKIIYVTNKMQIFMFFIDSNTTCFERLLPIVRSSGTVCAAYGTGMLIYVMIGSTAFLWGYK
jgi:hypothetical protein